MKSKRQDGGNEGHNLGQSSLPLLVISFPVPSSFQSELSLGQSGNSRSLLPPPPCAEPGGRGRHSLPGHPTPGPAIPGPAIPGPLPPAPGHGRFGSGPVGPVCDREPRAVSCSGVRTAPPSAHVPHASAAEPERSGSGAGSALQREQPPPLPAGLGGHGRTGHRGGIADINSWRRTPDPFLTRN